MQGTKNIQAINRDRVQVRHPRADLSQPMTSHVTVRHNGVNHAVVSSPSPRLQRGGLTTGQFSIAGHQARIVESVDSNDNGAAVVRYEGHLETESGCLWVQSFDSADHAIALLSALDPTVNALGVTVGPNHRIDFVTPPEVLLDLPGLGLLQVGPLTAEVIDNVPDWKGTPVAGGELFSASITRSNPKLTLITSTAQVHLLPNQSPDMDALTRHMAELHVSWTP